ncbi:MAG: hypothetical protein H6741_06195 [Alphaproteobacteria bacterium]|nr:hypothetical protein [Alphaproteobacteria bacterium]MCB9792300.1 hypothetical protein [Alphaproteobacteria bacterium]
MLALDGRGVAELLWAAVNNALYEQLRGLATHARVAAHADGSWTVEDNGRGIPPALHVIHPAWAEDPEAPPGLELFCAISPPDGSHDGGDAGEVTLGRGLTDLATLCALCEGVSFAIERAGQRWEARYSRGRAVQPVRHVGPARGRGTSLRFRADRRIFGEAQPSPAFIRERLREACVTLPSPLSVSLNGEALEPAGGLMGLLQEKAGGPLGPAQVFHHRRHQEWLAVAVGWTNADTPPREWLFVNGGRASAPRSALARAARKALRHLRQRGRVTLICAQLEEVFRCGRGQRCVNDGADLAYHGLTPAAEVFALRHPELSRAWRPRSSTPVICELSPFAHGVEQLRPRHKYDGAEGLHLAAIEEGRPVGIVSAWSASPSGAADAQRFFVHGPFGAYGEVLAAEILKRLHPIKEAVAWTRRPTPWEGVGFKRVGELHELDVPMDPSAGRDPATGVRVYSGVPAVRLRPEMYVGSRDALGLTQLLWEPINNALDLQIAGLATELRVTAAPDGAWTVEDDGPGFPMRHPQVEGRSVFDQVFLHPHVGPTWDGHTPHVHLSAHGLGLYILCALSERLDVTTHTARGRTWRQRFCRGLPTCRPEYGGRSPSRRGTRLHFRPDSEIFEQVQLPVAPIRARLREVSGLLPDLRILLNGEELAVPDGLLGLLRERASSPLRAEAMAEGEHGGVRVRAALGWTVADTPPRWWAFARLSPLSEPKSTCLMGAEEALAPLTERGRVLLLDVWLDQARFHGRTKGRLSNPEAQEATRRALEPVVAQLQAHHPGLRRASS